MNILRLSILSSLILSARFAFAQEATVEKAAVSELPSLLAIYKDLHTHPELSLQEANTSARLSQEIKELGFDVTPRVGGYGLVAILRNGAGPTVKGTGVTAYAVTGPTTRHIEGTADIDGKPGKYAVDIADNGEPGRNTDTFTLTATPTVLQTGTQRAPINAIQIIAIPEPVHILFGCAAALGGWATWRRRQLRS